MRFWSSSLVLWSSSTSRTARSTTGSRPMRRIVATALASEPRAAHRAREPLTVLTDRTAQGPRESTRHRTTNPRCCSPVPARPSRSRASPCTSRRVPLYDRAARIGQAGPRSGPDLRLWSGRRDSNSRPSPWQGPGWRPCGGGESHDLRLRPARRPLRPLNPACRMALYVASDRGTRNRSGQEPFAVGPSEEPGTVARQRHLGRDQIVDDPLSVVAFHLL